MFCPPTLEHYTPDFYGHFLSTKPQIFDNNNFNGTMDIGLNINIPLDCLGTQLAIRTSYVFSDSYILE